MCANPSISLSEESSHWQTLVVTVCIGQIDECDWQARISSTSQLI